MMIKNTSIRKILRGEEFIENIEKCVQLKKNIIQNIFALIQLKQNETERGVKDCSETIKELSRSTGDQL